MNERRNVRDMPFRRRHEGITVLERLEELELWTTIVCLLQVAVVLPAGIIKQAMLLVVQIMMETGFNMRSMLWGGLTPIDTAYSNRNIDSFSDEFLYRHMRFHKDDLHKLYEHIGIPHVLILDNGITCSGEYALLILLYRLHFPCTLASMEVIFGRDYSQISRIFNYCTNLVYDQHRAKVLGNIDWYSDRFDIYNEAYNSKIAYLNNNPAPGTVPIQLSNLFGSLDCTANAVCRPFENDNAQYAFYNHYHHGHFIIWQGITFPDGMVVLEGPEPGHYTDIMVWRDCQLRQQLELIMLEREAQGLARLKLYADKVYNNSTLVTAAWSLRHGVVQAWMTAQNAMMSKIRVSIEWAFGRIIGTNKYAAFSRTLMIQNSPLAQYYTVAVLLTNCRTCLCGDIDTLYFGVEPPTLEEYLAQD